MDDRTRPGIRHGAVIGRLRRISLRPTAGVGVATGAVLLAGAVSGPASGLGQQRASPQEQPVRVIPALNLPDRPPPSAAPAPSEPDEPPFIELILSEGTISPADPPVPGSVEPLPPERVRALLARLGSGEGRGGVEEDLGEAGAEQDLGGTGATGAPVDAEFAGDGGGAVGVDSDEPALSILSVIPAGETTLAPHVTVVFSEPMVALGRDGEALETDDVPARLDPAPAGSWRWLDVRTLRFQPDAGRLPGATEYTVTVPVGTTSAGGAALGEPVTHRFRTSGVRVLGGWPNAEGGAGDGVSDLRPPILLLLDQRVDPEEVRDAATLEAEVEGEVVRMPLELLDRSSLEALDERLGWAVAGATGDSWVALRPRRDLPAGAEAVLRLSAGLSSAEGDLPADRVQAMRWGVRGPLEFRQALCGQPEPCRTPAWLTLSFSNDLDPDQAVADLVHVEPSVADLRVWTAGHQAFLRGDFRPHTDYVIRVDRALRDRFGQRLDEAVTETVEFGAPRSFVRLPGAPFIALDPASEERLEIPARSVVQIEVAAYPVEPSDWPAFQAKLLPAHAEDPPWETGRQPLFSRRLAVPEGARGYAPVTADLADVFRDGREHAVLVVQGTAPDSSDDGSEADRYWWSDPLRAMAWVQATPHAVGAVWEPSQIVAWAVDLAANRPLGDVRVTLPGAGAEAVTGREGTAWLPPALGTDSVLVARWGEHVAILPTLVAGRRETWGGDPRHPPPVWFVLTDRGLYQPGEELEAHGWVRRLEGDRGRDVALPTGVDSVRFEVTDGRRTVVEEGSAAVSASGAFHLTARLPAQARSGAARIRLTPVTADGPVEEWSTGILFRVEEFRRPQYEVTVEADPGPHVGRTSLEARATARYYDGAPMPSAAVRWRIVGSPASWAPPGWGGWRFGWSPMAGSLAGVSSTFEGISDATGTHALGLAAGIRTAPFPVQLRLEAQIQDLNRQAGSAAAATTLHPARVAAGIRTHRRWTRRGEELRFDAVVTDLEGAPVAGDALEARAVAMRVEGRDSVAAADSVVSVECRSARLERPGAPAADGWSCGFRPQRTGPYRVEIEARDEEGRPTRSVEVVQVFGAGFWQSLRAGANLALTPDRTRYEPGDTARILVATPIHPANGLVTVMRRGIREVRPLELEEAGGEIRVALEEADIGRVGVRVDLASRATGGLETSGRAWLSVDEAARRLEVQVRPDRERLSPGDSVAVHVRVSDPAGRPAALGEVALWAVDEAVLDLARYRPGDPVQVLHRSFIRAEVELPHHAVRWAPRSPGAGRVSGELLDGITGAPLQNVVVTLETPAGTRHRTMVREGGFWFSGVDPGPYRLVVQVDRSTLLERSVTVGDDGLALGTVLVAGGGPGSVDYELSVAATTFNDLVVTSSRRADAGLMLRGATQAIGMPPPPEPAPEPPGDEIRLRSDFRPLAVFARQVALDADGEAVVEFRLPDTSTRYRIFAVATRGAAHAGVGESAVTAARDLVVRATPPRVLHPGDRPELPVVVQNASSRPFTVEVAARAEGISLTGGGDGAAGFRVRLPAGARQEIRFPARAGLPGDGALDVVVAAEELPGVTDAVRAPLSVTPARAPRAVATYEEVPAGGSLRLQVAAPPDATAGWGGLELGVSTTRLQPLAEIVGGLCLNPLFWPEHVIARVLGLAALDPALELLASEPPEASGGGGPGGPLPSPDELRALAAADAERLDLWLRRVDLERDRSSLFRYGFISHLQYLHAVHALAVAREAGVGSVGSVPGVFGQRVRSIWERERDRPARPRQGWAYATGAYALHVGLKLDVIELDVPAREWMTELVPEDLPVEVLAWLLPAAGRLDDGGAARARLLEELENRALTTAGTVTFRQGERATARGDGDIDRLVLASTRRSDAVALAVLLEEEPEHPLIPGLLAGLLGNRDGTPAGGVHENGWVLLAVGTWAAMKEDPAAVVDVRATLGDAAPEEVRLDPDRRSALLPGPLPEPGTTVPLSLTTRGQGTLFVRAGVRYAPEATLDMPAVERGFLVSRRYEAVDDSGDVARADDGSWRVRAGARVRVRVTLTALERRYQVQMLDPVPGGLEAINPTLAGTGFSFDPGGAMPPTTPSGAISGAMVINPIYHGPGPGPFDLDWPTLTAMWRAWNGRWATHEELRDDRMEAYSPLLPAGTYQTTYLVRATTPGEFFVPPPRVEESNHPETFGQGRADRVVVEVREGG